MREQSPISVWKKDLIIFSWLTKFFKKPLPRAHQPVSESTCSSRRWEEEVGVERGEERHSQPGIGAFQVSPCVAHGLQASPEPHQLNAPPAWAICAALITSYIGLLGVL